MCLAFQRRSSKFGGWVSRLYVVSASIQRDAPSVLGFKEAIRLYDKSSMALIEFSISRKSPVILRSCLNPSLCTLFRISWIIHYDVVAYSAGKYIVS